MFFRPLLAFVTVATLIVPSHLRAQAPVTDIDARVADIVRAWNVPGVGVAIVKDGKVVMTRGFGVRALGAPDVVNDHTPFYLASATKPFTVMALAVDSPH